MSSSQRCSECGAEFAADKQNGLCPCCLLALGLRAAEGGGPTPEGTSPRAETRDRATVNQVPLVIPHSSLGTVFGDYELLEEIARGGMGIVYRARQLSLDRVVAVKLLAARALLRPEYVKRFRVEASAAASLQHPNIVTIHEVGVHQGQHYLVMDYVAGPSLAKVIADSGLRPVDGERSARWMKTVAEAVHFAHEHGILHRDLKPSNVLLDASDQPRVTDFGLAKRLTLDTELGTRNSELESTLSGQLVGSPSYMPPEQVAAKRDKVSRRSDVYGLGATLYHLLTGRPPFQAPTLTDTLDQVLNAEPVAPRLLNPTVPRDLETICLKCLEKEPAKRYPTARALADDLERFLTDRPVIARPVGAGGRAWRWCRRQPVRAGLITTVVLLLGLGMSGVLWQWRKARHNAKAEHQQRQRADQQARTAEAAELLARRHAYAADMNLAQQALNGSDLGRAGELLDRYRPPGKFEIRSPKSEVDLRGWEWRYLWAHCRSEERFTLCQYSNAVTALAFSPDGKWLAVRRGDDSVVLWDALAKRQVTELPGDGYYKALAFAPEGNLLAWGNTTANGKHVASVCHVGSDRPTVNFPLSSNLVSVAFAPDARQMATMAYDGIVSVWDVETHQSVTHFATAPISVWVKRAGKAATRPEFFTDHYGVVLFSPDGQWLAVGEATPRIRLLDRAAGSTREIPVRVDADGITALAFSRDSKWLAAAFGAGDNGVHVWDLASDTETRLVGHSAWIAGLAFSPDGRTLASVGIDQTLRLWDMGGNTPPRCFLGNAADIWAVAWSRDGRDLLTGAADGSVRCWDPAARARAPYVVLPSSNDLFGLAFLPDGKTLLTVPQPEGEVVRWDTATARKLETLSFLGTNHLSLDLSRDGHWLALGDRAGNVQVWDFPERRLVTNLVTPAPIVLALFFSPAGTMLNAGAWWPDGRVVPMFWAVPGWSEIRLPDGAFERGFEPAFAPNERTLAIGYHDGAAAWWDLHTGQRKDLFRDGIASAVHVAFSPDAKWFATGKIAGEVTLWDIATRQAKSIGRGHRHELSDLSFSSDGRRLIASGTNPKAVVGVWDVETGRDLAALSGEPGWYAHIGFSPDGNTLFAVSLERTVLLWHAPSWDEIAAAEAKAGNP